MYVYIHTLVCTQDTYTHIPTFSLHAKNAYDSPTNTLIHTFTNSSMHTHTSTMSYTFHQSRYQDREYTHRLKRMISVRGSFLKYLSQPFPTYIEGMHTLDISTSIYDIH